MVRGRVGLLARSSTIIGLLIGAALVAGMPAFASRAAAQVDRSAPAATTPGTVEWQFSEPQPDWKPTLPRPTSKTVELERTTDALRGSTIRFETDAEKARWSVWAELHADSK